MTIIDLKTYAFMGKNIGKKLEKRVHMSAGRFVMLQLEMKNSLS